MLKGRKMSEDKKNKKEEIRRRSESEIEKRSWLERDDYQVPESPSEESNEDDNAEE